MTFEYDEQCGACRACVAHSARAHRIAIDMRRQAEARRAAALEREARRVYDHDRDFNISGGSDA